MCDDLGNVTGKYLVPQKEFNHMDFLWAIDVRKMLYRRMLQVLGKVYFTKKIFLILTQIRVTKIIWLN